MDITEIWGTKENIGPLEIAARSAVMFLLMVFMIRLSGMRPFGKGDVFDTVLTILMGAVLARGIVGATPFFSAVTAGIVIIGIHIILSNISFYNHKIGRVIKGKPIVLYRNGEFDRKNMDKVNITQHDIQEQLRVELNTDSLDEVEAIYFERIGKVSFVKKKPCPASPSPSQGGV